MGADLLRNFKDILLPPRSAPSTKVGSFLLLWQRFPHHSHQDVVDDLVLSHHSAERYTSLLCVQLLGHEDRIVVGARHHGNLERNREVWQDGEDRILGIYLPDHQEEIL